MRLDLSGSNLGKDICVVIKFRVEDTIVVKDSSGEVFRSLVQSGELF